MLTVILDGEGNGGMTTTDTTTMTTMKMCEDDRTVLPTPASSPTAVEGGWGKKGGGGNNTIIGGRGGKYFTVRVGHVSVPRWLQFRHDSGAHLPLPRQQRCHDGWGRGGEEGTVEL